MSPKNKEIKKRGNSETQSYEKHDKTCRKSDVKIIEKSLKIGPTTIKNQSKIHPKINTKNDAKKDALGDPPNVGRRTGR